MSTLQKTINILNKLSEKQIESIYSYVQFVSSQQENQTQTNIEDVDDILNHIIGIIPDSGKSLGDYREERIRERYGHID
ncbi:MAG: hypothetical protein IJV15_13200 [Lachnospiraceae bacterium]|nr:hypothetical protein [Lachnospiraceae bacterium]